MRRHDRETRRLLAAVARDNGAGLVGINHTGRSHLRARFVRDGVIATITLSSTPSDFHAYRNIIADAKRALRQQGER
jgi:hypothetical protein